MTSSDMQDTPAGRRAAGADGPRSSQPKRRTFTVAYKLAMIEKYDAAAEPGAKGALLRGEGLYDSHISYWRKARDSGALKSQAAAVPAVAGKGRPGMAAENERLRKRLAKAEVKLGQTRAALDIMGKAFAPVDALRERGLRHEAAQVIDMAVTELEPLTSVKRACELLGKSRATLHRQRNPVPAAAKAPPGPRAPHPAALTVAEQQALLAMLDSERFADKSPAQV